MPARYAHWLAPARSIAVDGVAVTASFTNVQSVAVDCTGAAIVADKQLNPEYDEVTNAGVDFDWTVLRMVDTVPGHCDDSQPRWHPAQLRIHCT